MVYFPYYVAGIWTHKNSKLIGFISDKKKLWPYCLIVIGWFIACILFTQYTSKLTPFFTGRHPYSDKVYYWGPVIRLTCYIIVGSISYAIIKITPQYHISKITEFGARTLQIYFWHKIFINILLHFEFLDICTTVVGTIVLVVVAVIMTFLLGFNIFKFPVGVIKNMCLKGGV